MQKLNDKYYLDTDSLNYILLERKVYEKGKNIGEEYFVNVGYYGKLEHLYMSLIEKEIKDDLGLIENISKVVELIKEYLDCRNNE